jgi:hypothetical protein
MNELPTGLALPDFRDRRTSLIVFGILVILLGCLCALMVPLMLLGQSMAARQGGTVNGQTMIPAVLTYLTLAVALIWLGIGSIMVRRWARALLLILAWSWLVVGIFTSVSMFFVMPRIMANVPAGARVIAIAVALVLLGVIFLAIPGILVLIYQNKNVKATCEAHDPVTRWTDRCPLPALALSVWLGLGALSMLMMPLAYHSVLPVFGVLISGLPGTVAFLVFAGLWGYLARAAYQLKPAAWWITVAMLVLFSVSNIVTFSRIDVAELYQRMGYTEQMIDQIESVGFFSSKTMVWWTALFCLPLFGYLLGVKRYFTRPAAAQFTSSPPPP